jgi:hypothetical protein
VPVCQFASSPKENQVAKPFIDLEQDTNSHGVPDDPEFDAGNFEFSRGMPATYPTYNPLLPPSCMPNQT